MIVLMANYEEQPSEQPDIQFDELTPEQQRSILASKAEAARLKLEEVAQNPDKNDEAYEVARRQKSAADQSLVEFKIEHGEIIVPGEDGDSS